MSPVRFGLWLQRLPNNVILEKVNNIVLTMKNMPNINTAKFIAVQNLKNMSVTLHFLVELTEEHGAALQAIYLRQRK